MIGNIKPTNCLPQVTKRAKNVSLTKEDVRDLDGPHEMPW